MRIAYVTQRATISKANKNKKYKLEVCSRADQDIQQAGKGTGEGRSLPSAEGPVEDLVAETKRLALEGGPSPLLLGAAVTSTMGQHRPME